MHRMLLLTCSVVMQASASRGSKKAANELDDWRVLSGKRHRGSPNVYEAGPSSKVKREHRRIKLKMPQYEPDWWQSHLDKRARVGFETLTSPSVADVTANSHGARVMGARNLKTGE